MVAWLFAVTAAVIGLTGTINTKCDLLFTCLPLMMIWVCYMLAFIPWDLAASILTCFAVRAEYVRISARQPARIITSDTTMSQRAKRFCVIWAQPHTATRKQRQVLEYKSGRGQMKDRGGRWEKPDHLSLLLIGCLESPCRGPELTFQEKMTGINQERASIFCFYFMTRAMNEGQQSDTLLASRKCVASGFPSLVQSQP